MGIIKVWERQTIRTIAIGFVKWGNRSQNLGWEITGPSKSGGGVELDKGAFSWNLKGELKA